MLLQITSEHDCGARNRVIRHQSLNEQDIASYKAREAHLNVRLATQGSVGKKP
jgi:hypothetical protein